VAEIIVTAGGNASWAGRRFRCALGRSGIRAHKIEGDGATPAGRFPLRRVLYRPDRLDSPPCRRLPVVAIDPRDGWCDDPSDPFYNRPVRLPYGASHERLWRDDHCYDLVVVVGHNDDPPVSKRGSAVFIHLATASYGATAGCVALALEDLQAILAGCNAGSALVVEAPGN
jgi:L,D-peptidoglycan transpeptidase YkuD (ErfK/YbiS/YcfS/YnhG family)